MWPAPDARNRMFAQTDPSNIIVSFKSAAKYVRQLIEDPSIGIERVEKILDAAHSIKYQVPRFPGIKYKSRAELIEIEKDRMAEAIQEFCLAFFRFPESFSNDFPSA